MNARTLIAGSILTVAAAAAVLVVFISGGDASPRPDDQRERSAAERVVFRGDFETRNLRQWDGVQRVAPDRIRIVTAPRAQGRYAARFEVRNGDNPIDANDRAEVQRSTGESEGDDRWYEWSTRFARGFPRTGAWQVVTQWRPERHDGSPSVGFYVDRGRITLQTWGHDQHGRPVARPRVWWSGPLRPGRWRHFKLRVRWSGDDRRGLIQLWVDGKKVTGRIRTRTLYAGDSAYLKQGYYRQRGIRAPGVVYHDGMTVTEAR